MSSGQRGRAIWALTGCLALVGGVLCVGGGIAVFLYGGNPSNVPTAGPGGAQGLSLQVVAVVDNASPGAPVGIGSDCQFTVTGTPDPQAGTMCNAQIVCAGQLLYGGPSAGYFPCAISGPPPYVSGSDLSTSQTDHDAAMSLDTASGSLTITDDAAGQFGAYQVHARVTSVL